MRGVGVSSGKKWDKKEVEAEKGVGTEKESRGGKTSVQNPYQNFTKRSSAKALHKKKPCQKSPKKPRARIPKIP